MLGLLKEMRRQDKLFALLALSALIVQIYLDLRLPEYIAKISRMTEMGDASVGVLAGEGMRMLLLAFGSFLAAGIAGYFIARATAGFSRDLREKIFQKVLSFSLPAFSHFSGDSLLTRTTNDILQIQNFFSMGLSALVKVPIIVVWAMSKILRAGWEWTLLVGAAVLILALMLSLIFFLALPRFLLVQKLTDRLNQVTRESIAGIRVVRAFHAEAYRQRVFEEANGRIAGVHFFVNRLMAIFQPGMTSIMSLLSVAIYWVGVYMLNGAGTDTELRLSLFANMMVIMNYASQVFLSFMLLAMTLLQSPRAMVAARRISEVLETETEIRDGDSAVLAKPESGAASLAASKVIGMDAHQRIRDRKWTGVEGACPADSDSGAASLAASKVMHFPESASSDIVSKNEDEDLSEMQSAAASSRGRHPAVGASVPKLVFQNVSFRYPDAAGDALSGIAFQIYPGEAVALIGATGSGKSAVLQLPMRLYDVREGEILLDGIPIKRYPLRDLRERFGYVPQQAFLFSGTVSSNVSFPGSMEHSGAGLDMQEALSVAQARAFVDKLPEGRQAPVAQGGMNFSGGERQRLSIARAIYRKPQILLLDDAFSALDYRTERLLWEGLKKDLPDAAILFSSQRISSVRWADRILLLSEGKIAAEGSHESLLAQSPLYRSMAESQENTGSYTPFSRCELYKLLRGSF